MGHSRVILRGALATTHGLLALLGVFARRGSRLAAALGLSVAACGLAAGPRLRLRRSHRCSPRRLRNASSPTIVRCPLVNALVCTVVKGAASRTKPRRRPGVDCLRNTRSPKAIVLGTLATISAFVCTPSVFHDCSACDAAAIGWVTRSLRDLRRNWVVVRGNPSATWICCSSMRLPPGSSPARSAAVSPLRKST